MRTYFTLKVYGITMSLAFLISFSLFLSCNKIDLEVSGSQQSSIQKSNAATTLSSVNGFVTGENGEPIAGAYVKAGSKTCFTDQYGFFELKNADVATQSAVVTVKKNGYFSGIKTYDPAKGQGAFFRIKLIPQKISGTLNAADGGIISLPSGLSISFSAGGFVNNATGAAYNGVVSVSAFRINPAADDIHEIMPGDLRGIDASGELKKLTSYGMAAVELTGASGEKLQLAPRKPATITMPMDASVLAHAPASIPLWHFDEAKGIWVEEGSATKKGNVYTGSVSHFSFWNFDWPQDLVQFECTVVDIENAPMSNVRMNIYEVSNPYNASSSYTNEQGYVSGLIPANTTLRLEILGDGACASTAIYTQTFTTTNSNISWPALVLHNNSGIGYVSGTLKDCDNYPVSNGGVFMQKNGQYYHYPVNSNGIYNFTTIICNSTAEISLMGYDAVASVYSAENIYTITNTSSNTINIQACGNSSDQFINYNINGVSYKLTYPAASFTYVERNGLYTFSSFSNLANHFTDLQFSGINMAPGSQQLLSYFTASQVMGPLTQASPVLVNITETTATGDYISGNFSGLFIGPAPNYTPYSITCSFRIEGIF